MFQFSFTTAGRILFGTGTVAQAAVEAARMGDHVEVIQSAMGGDG